MRIGTDIGKLEETSGSLTRALASRTSRRSFMGRLGRGAIAASLGAAGAQLLAPAAAQAVGCGSCSGCSIGCGNLNQWNRNSCPPGSCSCGSWVIRVASSTCSSTLRRWTDCCNTGWCGDHAGGNCNSIGDDGRRHPSCCNPREYFNGSCNANGRIVCRRHSCVTGANPIPDPC
jgi:hypothetical protein